MLRNTRFTHYDLHTRFLILFSALVPFELDMLPVMLIWTGFWIFTGEYRKFRPHRLGPWALVILFFFLMHLVGFLYTENLKLGWIDTRNKLSFLFLPVLLSTYKLTEKRRNAILAAFFFSCVSISILLLFRNLAISLVGWQPPLTYRHFCLLVHPSYFAMYQCLALIVFFCVPISLPGINLKKPPYRFVLPAILVTAILFASSKTGLLSLIICSVIFACWYFFINRSKIRRTVTYAVLGLVVVALLSTQVANSPFNRLKTAGQALWKPGKLDGTTHESTAMRLLIWTSSMEIIRDNPIFGVGTGDLNPELQKSYKAHNFAYPLIYKLNSHSQILESQIMLGVFGLIPILALLFGPLIYSLRRGNMILLLFTSLMFVNLSVESMLYQPTACVFYSFFLLLLLKKPVFIKNDGQNGVSDLTVPGDEKLTYLVQTKS